MYKSQLLVTSLGIIWKRYIKKILYNIGILKVYKFEQNKIYGPIKGVNGVYFVKATTITEAVALTADEIVAKKQQMKTAIQWPSAAVPEQLYSGRFDFHLLDFLKKGIPNSCRRTI